MPVAKVCPYCAEEVKAEAILCKHCRSDLREQPPTNEQTSRAASAEPSPRPASPDTSELGQHAESSLPSGQRATGAVVSLLLLAAIGAGVFYLGSHHLITGPHGLYTIPKPAFSFTDTFVSLQSPFDLARHPIIVARVTAAGRASELPGGELLAATAAMLDKGAKTVDAIVDKAKNLDPRSAAQSVGQLLKSGAANPRTTNDSATAADARILASAIEAYAVDNARYPTGSSINELQAILFPEYAHHVPKNLQVRSGRGGYQISSTTGQVLVVRGDVSDSVERVAPLTATTTTGTMPVTQETTHEPSRSSSNAVSENVVPGQKRASPVYRLPAPSFTRAEHLAAGILGYGSDVVTDATPTEGTNHRVLSYEVELPPGMYDLWAEYAAESSRPVELWVDDEYVKDIMEAVTGGWREQKSIWQMTLRLRGGKTSLRLQRDAPFPHLRVITLIEKP